MKQQQFIFTFDLFGNPELIKVLTIKRRYVEQMPQVKSIDFTTSTIVGRCEYFVIFEVDDRGFHKIHQTDFVGALTGQHQDKLQDDETRIKMWKQVNEAAWERYNSLPQIFAD